jgi:hypothetical protein
MGPSDFAGMLNVLIPLLIVAAIAILYLRRGWTERTGLRSEMKNLSGNAYSVLDHPGLRTDEGIVTVDYCIVSVYGIFLLVIDNFKGRVSGGEENDNWTLSSHGRTETVGNPLKRTEAFSHALAKVLSDYRYPDPIAIVAYPTGTVLDVKSTQHVTYLSKVLGIVKSYRTARLTFSQASGITVALQYADVNNKADDEVLSDMM